MELAIRRVRADEWEALRDLRLRALSGAPEMFGTTLSEAQQRSDEDWRAAARRGASDERWATFVADESGLVGMATAALGDDGVTELLQMWVEPRARRRGIGARLCEAVVARARDWGSPVVRLAVNATGPAAIDLYRSVGFVDTGRREPDLFHGRAGLATVMERDVR